MADDPNAPNGDDGNEPEPMPQRRRGFDDDGNAIVQYIGDGNSYLIGVPKRDLSAGEFMALPDVEKNAVIRSPLYDYQGYQMSRDAVAANGGPIPRRDESTATRASDMRAEAHAQRTAGKAK